MTVNEADVAMAYLLEDLEWQLTDEHVASFQEINDELVLLRKQVADMQAEMVRQSDKLQFLSALESAGVDNWQGYGHAYEILDEWKEEDKE